MIILAINTADVRLPSCLDYLVPLLAHTFNFSVIIVVDVVAFVV